MAITVPRVFSALDNAVQNQLSALNAPGVTIGLTNRRATLYVGLYGYADLANHQAVQAHHLFQIGSISKSFTSLALLKLQERGQVNLHAPLTDYLPWFQVRSQYAPITLEHLLSHTAGIINGSDASQSAYTEAWYLRDTETGAPPGEFFHYSNTGYKTLGLVLETLLGMPVQQALHELILAPLGMQDSYTAIGPEINTRLAVGYHPYPDDCPAPSGAQMSPASVLETNTADGSISAHAEDMCRYLRLLLNRGQGLVSPESFAQMIAARIPTGDDLHGEHYGLGLEIPKPGSVLIRHSGGMVGYSADLLADLEAGLGVVVLTNGVCEPAELSAYALECLRAAEAGDPPPAAEFSNPFAIPEAADYAGEYRLADPSGSSPAVDRFELVPRPPGLTLSYAGGEVALEKQGQGVFYTAHPDFARFQLCFGRDSGGSPGNSDPRGPVLEAFHGPHWYTHSRYHGQREFPCPPGWQAFTGHYRSYNPWLTNFRIVLRKGKLVFIYPLYGEEPLHPINDEASNDDSPVNGRFRLGADARSPERLSFDIPLNNRAQRASLSGGVYSRTFTP